MSDIGGEFSGVTPEMEDDALAKVAASISEETAAIWEAMRIDLSSGGHLAKVLLSFRDGAATALGDLAICSRDQFESDAAHSREVMRLQEEIQRLLLLISAIRSFRDRADPVQPLSDNDSHYVQQIIGDE